MRARCRGSTAPWPPGGDGVDEDLAFHRAMAEATGNPQFTRLLAFLEQYLHEAMRVTRGNEARRPDFMEAVRAEHRAIVEAIASGDPAAARRKAAAPHAARRAAAEGRRPAVAPPCHPRHEDPTMKLLITGGAGFVGARLARTLLARGTLAGQQHRARWCWPTSAPPPADLLADAASRRAPARCSTQCAALRARAASTACSTSRRRCRANARLDFDLGMRSNLDSTRALLDALRARAAGGAAPARLVFSSSVAVFGPDPARAAARASSPTTRCPRRRPRTARTSWSAST